MDSENATINFSPSGGSNQQPSAWPSALTVAPHTRAAAAEKHCKEGGAPIMTFAIKTRYCYYYNILYTLTKQMNNS